MLCRLSSAEYGKRVVERSVCCIKRYSVCWAACAAFFVWRRRFLGMAHLVLRKVVHWKTVEPLCPRK